MMKTRGSWRGGVATVLMVLAGVSSARAAEAPVVIAVQPSATAEQLSAKARELSADLEGQLGRSVEIRFPTSYAGVVEALRFGHAQVAFMGAWPAALAHEHGGAEVVLAEIRDVIVDGQRAQAPSYSSSWIVLRDSPIRSLEELRGKRAAFPSQLSTSGYVAPMAKLLELGLIQREEGAAVDPKQFFGEVVFSGGYAQAWQALKAGQVDVSVIAGDVPEALYREVMASTRRLETQGPIPSHAVVFGASLEEPLRGQVLQALLSLNERPDLIKQFISGIFVRFEPTTTAQHLGPLAQWLDATGLNSADALR
jgi:phosphonate transport system substrate-binding protein